MTEENELKESPSGLVINLTGENFVRIGDIRIYLGRIKSTGGKGGKPSVAIVIKAPKEVKIQRCER